MRTEHDLLGSRELPDEVLYGIHTLRARENFGTRPAVAPELIKAYAAVKLAAVRTNRELGYHDERTAVALEAACAELMAGKYFEHFPVSALQGGAGTSTNMNVNEVLANLALRQLGLVPGSYDVISPLDTVNLHQSTNDTYPTALKVAAIRAVRRLDPVLNELQAAFQELERAYAQQVKIGRTELMDAVPYTLGREFGAMAEAFARDRWRVFKCEERLRVVNLGGTAIGTGLGAPRQYIFLVTERLREITGLGLARAENMVDATQNMDCFAEVSGILRTVAVNLLKISGDLRLLASGPECGLREIVLPPRQAGSSIMPGKINPVMTEYVSAVAMQVLAADTAIVQAAAAGQLELNAFLPVIAHHLLDSLELLNEAIPRFTAFCIKGIAQHIIIIIEGG